MLNSEVGEQVEESRKEWSHRGTELRAFTQLFRLGACQVTQPCCSSPSSSTFQSLRSQEPRGWDTLGVTGLEGAELSRESSRNGEQFSKNRTIFPSHQLSHKETELSLIPGLSAACFKNLLPYNIIMPRE